MNTDLLFASRQCVALIKDSEKFRAKAYKPAPNDVWTIGYGHTNGVKFGDICTLKKAEDYLIDDMGEAEGTVNELVTVPLRQYQFDALVSLVFNIGSANFASSTMLKLLNKRDYEGAAKQFPRWKYQKGKVLNGLIERRAKERALFEQK